MADQQLQTILNSGGISSMYIGGTTSADKVQKKSDVDLVAARVATLENTGMTVLSGSSLTPQTIGTSATAVASFDTLSIEAGTCTTGSVAGQSMTADCDGVFKLRYEAFVSYSNSVDITWQIYKNGIPFGSSITLSGQGAKVFPIVLLSSANLLAADVLKLYATATASTAITITQANGTLEKTAF